MTYAAHTRALWILLGLVVGLLVFATSSMADPPACPTAPADSASSDEAVVVLTHLRQDTAASCAVAHADANRAHDDEAQLHADEAQLHTDLTGTLTVQFPAGDSGGSGQAVTVTNWPATQQVAYDSATSSAIDGQAQSQHGDLWVLIGVIVGCFCLDVFLRKVWP